MSLGSIITAAVGLVSLITSISVVVWVILNRPTYKYVDSTFVRKDTYDLQFDTVIKAIEELKDKIDKLIEEEHNRSG